MDEFDRGLVLRFMDAIEEGKTDLATAYSLTRNFDPLLTYFILRFLREKYPPHQAKNEGSAARLLELLSTYSDLAKIAQPPRNEAMLEWFDDTYEMREFFNKRSDYVELIIDKIEG